LVAEKNFLRQQVRKFFDVFGGWFRQAADKARYANLGHAELLGCSALIYEIPMEKGFELEIHDGNPRKKSKLQTAP
jgi:hypothetical protein